MKHILNKLYTKARIEFFIFTIIALSIVSSTGLFSQGPGNKFIRNYSNIEYNSHAQCKQVSQAENGILVFCTRNSILEYDGVKWREHYLDVIPMQSMAIDRLGTIFVGGGDSDLWRLSLNSDGKLEFISLKVHIQKEYQNFGVIRRIHALNGKIYFIADSYLFIWDHKKMTTLLPSSERFKGSFIYNGSVIVQDSAQGMVRIEDNGMVPFAGAEQFGSSRIRLFTPFSGKISDDTFLTGSRGEALFLYHNGKKASFPTEIDEVIKKNLLHGIRLTSGDFAIGTRIGLFIIDPNGRVVQKYDHHNGLQNDYINYVFQDSSGNIWLCLNNGISKIQYHSPLTRFDNRNNLPGLVLSLLRHQGTLFVGTTNGLFQEGEPSKFVQVPNMTGSCNSLVSANNHLLTATADGVFNVKKDSLEKINTDVSLTLLPSKYYPGVIWCGTDNKQLLALENSGGQWRNVYRSEELPGSIHSIVETAANELWLGTASKSLIKLTFPAKFKPPLIQSFGEKEKLLGRESYVVLIDERLTAAMSNGLFIFNAAAGTFIPNPLLGETFSGGENGRPVFRIIQAPDRHIWFSSESRNYHAIPRPTGKFEIIDTPFRPMPLEQINTIYPDTGGKTIWFGGVEGLFRYDRKMKKDYKQPFKALVRKVVLNKRSENPAEIYFGNNVMSGKAAPLEIDYEDRNVYFEYAATFFENEAQTLFRCKLHGFNNQWTAWSSDSNISFTNLEPGNYTFIVEAKNVYGTISQTGQYRFRILLPWYRTWWMILFYVLLLAVMFWLAVRWRSSRLVREKLKLEKIVHDRTREIEEKKSQLERQTLQLRSQSQKLKEMDQVKARFFANISHEFRTPLTLIMGPLEQMLQQSGDKHNHDKYRAMFHHSQQLLDLINQLLDLSRLDSGKAILRTARHNIVRFLEGIAAHFESEAQNKDLDLQFNTQSTDIFLYFDSQKMERMMNNLLMNAVKFTPPGGKISLSLLMIDDQWVEISVKDSGAGIPPDHIPFIFDRFYQAENMQTGKQQGTGIGLALVKEYVDLHHGKIDVHSHEGGGTEFVLRFPTGTAHLQPNQIIDDPESPVSQSIPSAAIQTGDEHQTIEPVDVETDEEADGKPIILVVEDNSEMRRYIRDTLQSSYKIFESNDGESGIQTARKIIPDMIVSDVMMPGIDGYQLCRTLKQDIKTSHIPIILLTAKASEDSVVEGLDTGADDYITKPFSSRILLARIKNLVEIREKLQIKIRNQILLEPEEADVPSMEKVFIDELKAALKQYSSDPDFGVDQLSKVINVERSTIYRKIKALTGEGPRRFISTYRLKRGQDLLEKGWGTVSQVALEVGFSSLQYFSTSFKDQFGVLPSEYMAAKKSKKDKKR